MGRARLWQGVAGRRGAWCSMPGHGVAWCVANNRKHGKVTRDGPARPPAYMLAPEDGGNRGGGGH